MRVVTRSVRLVRPEFAKMVVEFGSLLLPGCSGRKRSALVFRRSLATATVAVERAGTCRGDSKGHDEVRVPVISSV